MPCPQKHVATSRDAHRLYLGLSPAASRRHGNEPMTSKPRDITDFRFSTADWGERDRLAILREEIGRMVVKLDPEPLIDGAFHAEAALRELPGLGTGSWSCTNLKIARPRELLDGNDDFILTIITSGNVNASQRGRQIDLGPGEAVLMSSAEAGNMAVPSSPARFVGLRLPRKALVPLVSNPTTCSCVRCRRTRKHCGCSRFIFGNWTTDIVFRHPGCSMPLSPT